MQLVLNQVRVISDNPPRDYFKIFLKCLYIISLALYVYFLVDGWEFYQTALQNRPHHSGYRDLRPAGFIGQGFGVLGAAMLSFMMLYSIRKRTRLFGNWGRLSRWLDIHTYFGIMGPLFIILHTSFKVEGLVAVGFWAMVAVALSGVIGRYLYRQIPRTPDGAELSLQEISKLNGSYYNDLRENLNLNQQQIIQLDHLIAAEVARKENFVATLIKSPFKRLAQTWRIRRLKKHIRKELQLEEPFLYKTVHLAWRHINLQRRAQRLNRIRQWFHYWHVFHKPFAIILYIVMAIHIGVAIWLGYTWIF